MDFAKRQILSRRASKVAAAAAKSKRLGVDDQRTMASHHRAVSGFAIDVVLLARKEVRV